MEKLQIAFCKTMSIIAAIASFYILIQNDDIVGFILCNLISVIYDNRYMILKIREEY